jgi:hypothetical protein
MVQSIQPFVRRLRSIPCSLSWPGGADLRRLSACLRPRSPALAYGPRSLGAGLGQPRAWPRPWTVVVVGYISHKHETC